MSADKAFQDLSVAKQALLRIRDLQQKLAVSDKRDHEPIAVCGMAVRLPGEISSPEMFWNLLANGGEAISTVPPDRWDHEALHGTHPDRPGGSYSRHGGFLSNVDQFDAEYFGISPREAERMDPQHRILLEVVTHALEDAAIAPAMLSGTNAGVFIGLSNSDYMRHLLADPSLVDAYSTLGGALSVAAGRISYLMNIRGPSLVIDTACSSSLVAVHLACNSLRMGESSLAIVGGMNLMLAPEGTISFANARMLSRDGRCKTFDAAADGYVRGEGCGIVILKRLSDAQNDGDRILAVVRGSAVNQDGRSASLTAPNGPSQSAVIAAALQVAKVKPGDVDFVEAHGTGTPLGDPIEVQALAAVYGKGRPIGKPLQISSVKTNIGHLEAAAGIVGLIKAVLSLDRGQLLPHRNFVTPNPLIAWDQLPVRVVTEAIMWPSTKERERYAGVSSFGFSGTNCHVLLGEAPPRLEPTASSDRRIHILCLSARSQTALRELAAKYECWFQTHADQIEDICFAANVGRTHQRCRLVITARTRDELEQRMSRWLADGSCEGVMSGEIVDEHRTLAVAFSDEPAIGVVFARELYSTSQAFRAAFDQCASAIERHLPGALVDMLGFSGTLPAGSVRCAFHFAVQYAFYKMWAAWGLSASIVIGCKSGEHVAACVAGLLSLEDALELTAGVIGSRTLALSTSAIPFISTATGKVEEAWPHVADALITGTNRAEAWTLLSRRGSHLILTIGSDVFLQEDVERDCASQTLLMPSRSSESVWRSIVDVLQALYLSGAAIDWLKFDWPGTRKRLALPTYPFQRKRYWLESPGASAAPPLQSDWDLANAAAARQSEVGPLAWDPKLYLTRWGHFDRLTAACAEDTLLRFGVFRFAGERHSVDELIANLSIRPIYAKLLGRWLRLLMKVGVLEFDGLKYRNLRPFRMCSVASLFDELEREFHDESGLLIYARRTAENLREILTGREQPLSILFPDGTFDFAESLYEKSPSARYINMIVTSALQAVISAAGERVIRILEIGAGTGAATSAILPMIPENGEYWFTDLSAQFLNRAKSKFAMFGCMRFAQFDLNRSLAEQELPSGKFDVVIASNVLHATRDAGESMSRAFEFLRPGGLLILVEPTFYHSGFDLTFGLVEGWDTFDDESRVEHPLLSADAWVALATGRGFADARYHPSKDSLASFAGLHVVLALSPCDAHAQVSAFVTESADMRKAAAEVTALNESADLVRKLQAAMPDERRAIMRDFVRASVSRVLRLSHDEMPGDRERLTDLGADSLMALELKSHLGRGLGVEGRLSSTIIFDTGTVEELVKALLQLLFPEVTPVLAQVEHAKVLSVQQVGDLSDEEVQELLNERLRSVKGVRSQ